jgi:hypothetical protein
MLLRDNSTRWNSTYRMIERALLLREAIDLFCLQFVDSGNLEASVRINDDTWVRLERLCEILKLCEYTTLRLEGSAANAHHGALWKCLPVIEYLLQQFEELKKSIHW